MIKKTSPITLIQTVILITIPLILLQCGPATKSTPEKPIDKAQQREQALDAHVFARQLYDRILREHKYYTDRVEKLKKQIEELEAKMSLSPNQELVELRLDSAKRALELESHLVSILENQILPTEAFKENEKKLFTGERYVDEERYQKAIALFREVEGGLGALLNPRKKAEDAYLAKAAAEYTRMEWEKMSLKEDASEQSEFPQADELMRQGEDLLKKENYKEAKPFFVQVRQIYLDAIVGLKQGN